ncbi:dihydrolipoyl dehydrogenase [Natrinema halophilum]|uniref:dihydrolipoyl dehydrogenase n=1 Tax=Natrinema halophilum TaxID=1699371 RepID=UPI001F48B924|nr:dihydrolipoyl dehydrogenase [Natrinema halophilum]UHQ96275.1 dihydrolipoyl dehydrogenase [Natrinema halophilum]
MVVGNNTTSTDVLVIGGGPGGYVAAIRASQLGLDVTLVEKEAYGGTCLNHGCIPSKALVSATELAHRAGTAEHMGVHADPAIDLQGVINWKDDVVEQLTSGVEKLCKGNGVNLIEGTAEFADETTARIVHDGEGQGTQAIEFEHAIVATGSRPIELPGFPFTDEHVHSSREALAFDHLPDRLLVVGAGYIGMELATVFATAGSEVTVVEQLNEALPTYEDDITRIVRKSASDRGIEFNFGEAASSYEDTGHGLVVETESEDGQVSEYECDEILVAVGRRPVTDTLGLDAIGLEPDENGFLPTDDQARTDVETVFAIGDVAGEPMLAHAAMHEGHVAAEVAAGEPAALDARTIPAVVFTDPEVATVGLTEAEAESAGFDPNVGEFQLSANGRALTRNESNGFVRVVASSDGEFILGAQIVSPDASELVAELGLAIEIGAVLEDVAATVHAHPTLSEAVKEAAANARGEAIHSLNRSH